ncbi:hypothetical protein [Staphylococcus epidermidis]|uniref:hypothetical protein n=1 Tax=Staphylococcus epidermidis TaxID=1282 RepID=UPI0011A470F7|nr:hypothetical protein [Staphylococcus epidermidis]MBM0749966.1 hypothetical protein [Staphylococcus epidermidis]
MKIKLLGTLALSSVLLLTACGQEEEKKEKDNKTETNKKDEKKETQKKTEGKKENKDDKTKEDTDNNDQQSNEQQDNQVNEQQQAQEQQANQQQEPSYEEQMRANAKVAKQNGYTGIPNGDIGGVPTSDKAYSNDQLDPETGLPKDDAVPQDTE